MNRRDRLTAALARLRKWPHWRSTSLSLVTLAALAAVGVGLTHRFGWDIAAVVVGATVYLDVVLTGKPRGDK
jgi:hypothetical protein